MAKIMMPRPTLESHPDDRALAKLRLPGWDTLEEHDSTWIPRETAQAIFDRLNLAANDEAFYMRELGRVASEAGNIAERLRWVQP